MRNFCTIVMVFALFLAGGCGGRGNGNGAANLSAAEISSPGPMQIIPISDSLIRYQRSDTVHMGKIRSGEIVARTLGVKNTGDIPLVILDVGKTCGCVELEYPRQPLKAGEEALMELEFDSRGIEGFVYKTVFLRTSSDEGNYMLIVTADVE